MTLAESRTPGSSDGASKPAAAPSRRSGPVDPRLLHYARGTRRYLLLTVVLGGVTAALVLAQAWLIANTISDVVVHHRGLAHVRTLVVLLAVVICGRALVAWLGERAAHACVGIGANRICEPPWWSGSSNSGLPASTGNAPAASW